MAGTVVQGARVWTGPSPWQEADISPKAELFPFWLTHSHPDDIKPSLPIREYSLGRWRNILSGPANLLSSPPQLIKCPVSINWNMEVPREAVPGQKPGLCRELVPGA